eukprot:3939035-Rhodomonas_salina.1
MSGCGVLRRCSMSALKLWSVKKLTSVSDKLKSVAHAEESQTWSGTALESGADKLRHFSLRSGRQAEAC